MTETLLLFIKMEDCATICSTWSTASSNINVYEDMNEYDMNVENLTDRGMNGMDVQSEHPVIIDLTKEDSDHLFLIDLTNEDSTEENDSDDDHSLTIDEDIDMFLASGKGTYGDARCALEVKNSCIVNGGVGVWIRAGYSFVNEEIITEYCGRLKKSREKLSEANQLRTINIDNVSIVGNKNAINGFGVGSLINASVQGRFPSNVRFFEHNQRIFAFAHCSEQYPLVGPTELYASMGVGWWKLYRRMVNVHGAAAVNDL